MLKPISLYEIQVGDKPADVVALYDKKIWRMSHQPEFTVLSRTCWHLPHRFAEKQSIHREYVLADTIEGTEKHGIAVYGPDLTHHWILFDTYQEACDEYNRLNDVFRRDPEAQMVEVNPVFSTTI